MEIIYEPNLHIKVGLRVWPQMIRDVIRSRELIWRLFIRNWSARYKQSVLGYFWAVIMPIVAIGTFVILNKTGVVNIDTTDIPYPLFALIGLAVWQIFSTGLQLGCQSLVQSGDMISKINFSVESLVFASMLQVVFEFLVKLILILILLVFYRYLPPFGAVFFLFAVLPMIFFTAGFALIFSLLTGIIRDTLHAVTLFTTFLMFLTPVLYPLSSDKSIFFRLNPLAPLINAPRDLVTYGYICCSLDFFISSILSILIFLICWRVFYLVKTKIPERV